MMTNVSCFFLFFFFKVTYLKSRRIYICLLIMFLDFEASFRGHPLEGKIITVPKGYKGLTFYEHKKPEDPKKKREFVSTGTFTNFTYWNFDKLPSKNDALIGALDWIDIADAVSRKINFIKYKNSIIKNKKQFFYFSFIQLKKLRPLVDV